MHARQFGREGNGESLGQLDGASLSNLPRASSRGGNAKPDCTLSANTTCCPNGIVLQRTNANEALVLERDGEALPSGGTCMTRINRTSRYAAVLTI